MTIVFNGQIMTTSRDCALRLLAAMQAIKEEQP